MIGTSVTGQFKNKLHVESNFGNDRIVRPSVSRAFGAPFRSDGSTLQNSANQDARNIDRVNMSRLFKPFGLQTKNTTLDSIREENDRLHQNASVASIRSSRNATTVSRTFGLAPENVCSTSIQNNNRLIQDVREDRSSFAPTSFGLEMRSLSTLRGLPLNENSKLNQDPNISSYRSTEQYQMSNTSRITGPAFRNTTLTNGLQIQERCNSEIGNGEFRVPSVPRMIRGRNAISSTRLFSHQNIDKCKNLSNINGFEVSHISRREMDTLSESRLGLMRNGWMDKQSTSGSVYSTCSVKAQVRNLLENLHFSILNMGPNIPVEAVTMEFDKAKQGLDNIPEMSFSASVRDIDAVSVQSHVSKYNCPVIIDHTKSVINGECLNLKSGKEVLKSLISTNNDTKLGSKLDWNQSQKASIHNTMNLEVDADQEDNELVFKKPKPFKRQRKSSTRLKIRTPPVKKNLPSKASRVINLKQWYPIAIGDDLALCGVDEQGVMARTDAVKKRLTNRKVELINGLNCILIGSPSKMALALPRNIASLLKNGLTSRWRVLQKELLSCQTAEQKKQKRKSKSPAADYSPMKKKSSPVEKEKQIRRKSKSPNEKEKSTKRKSKSPSKVSAMRLRSPQKVTGRTTPKTEETSPRRVIKRKYVKTPKKLNLPSEEKTSGKRPFKSRVISSPRKREQDVCTRSGRNVKPPSKFWIVAGGNDTPGIISVIQENAVVKKTKATKSKKANVNQKALNESLEESYVVDSVADKVESSEKSKASGSHRKKGAKAQQIMLEDSTKETPEVGSSMEIGIPGTRRKRKQEYNAEVDSVKRKKSKIEDSEQFEEELVTCTKETPNIRKQKKTQKATTQPPKTKAKQQQQQTKKKKESKKTVKSSSANTSETKFIRETEEDCEFQLDDIEIPKFGNLSENTQLTRSQLRLVSAETPPLKYFNSNLNVFSTNLTSTTPMRTPEWFISQRTESEVKRFQKRRAEAFKKKVEVKRTKKTVVTEKVQSRDLKKVLEWVAEKTVHSPVGNSQVLQYVLPSRRQLEQEDEEEDEEDDSEFL